MRVIPLFALFGLALLPAVAQADADPAADPQVARLLAAKSSIKWNHVPAGKSERYGHAEALVEAPATELAKVAQDFGHYKELHRKFKTARVVNKEGDKTDVYMRYPVQIGMLTVEFHEVMRFEPPRASSNLQVIEGNALKGDMKQGQTVITIKPVDAKHSLVSVDILLVPRIPAPQSLVDEELRDGAQDFVDGLRDRAQGHPGAPQSL